ncbi:MAG: hypothetical protein AB9828_11360 [Sphaerochaetaceae bacterium]
MENSHHHYGFPCSRKMVVVLVFLLIVTASLWAEVSYSGAAKLTVSTIMDLKAESSYSIRMPVLVGEGPLTSGNNIKFKGLLGLSPIAVTFNADAILTPVAVLELNIGGAAGTGWGLTEGLQGLLVKEPLQISPVSDSLGGLYYLGKAGAALQFDTAAIFPGDWTSVVMRTYHELNYQGYTGATADQLWSYELGGYRKDGFKYEADYLIGYQMPLMLNTVALQLETSRFYVFDDTVSDTILDVSVILNFGFTDDLSLMVVTQFTDKERQNTTNDYLVVKGDWRFTRVVGILNYAF